MNNEPVVWISEYTLKNCLQGNFTDEVRATTKETTNCTIPLYTHPVQKPMMVLDGNRVYPAFKELTDEEIISTMVQFDVYSSDDHCLIEAGRAILRKAQENG